MMCSQLRLFLHLLPMLVLPVAPQTITAQTKKPNVILIMTDDQGYGDLGCPGSTIVQTPNLDQLHKQCIRLTNFHVDPTCSPTRSAMRTGRYSTCTGVWHTIMRRSLMNTNETTLAEVFGTNGYSTGIFGKWNWISKQSYRQSCRRDSSTGRNHAGYFSSRSNA